MRSVAEQLGERKKGDGSMEFLMVEEGLVSPTLRRVDMLVVLPERRCCDRRNRPAGSYRRIASRDKRTHRGGRMDVEDKRTGVFPFG